MIASRTKSQGIETRAPNGVSPKPLDGAFGKCRDFWEAKAEENPYWYVSSFGPYARRDLDQFWNSGKTIWSALKEDIGYSPRPTDVVVEIGCGVGRLTRAIAPDVGWINAFDISDKMLELASQHELANATFHLTNGDDLSAMADSSADLVLAYCVLHHLPSEQALRLYLREMFRVVKPGGLIAFTLTPRDWRVRLEPLTRMRRWLLEIFADGGPKGLYRREWIGIRPSKRAVMQLLPNGPSRATTCGENWLFFSRRHSSDCKAVTRNIRPRNFESTERCSCAS